MNQSIYIVDDDPSVVEALVLLIESEGDLDVCGTAATAHEALAAIPEARPDLVITDLSLPDIDGIQLIMRLHTVMPGQRTVLFSAHPEAEYAQHAHAAGANMYLQKGDADTLLKRVREVLNGHPV